MGLTLPSNGNAMRTNSRPPLLLGSKLYLVAMTILWALFIKHGDGGYIMGLVVCTFFTSLPVLSSSRSVVDNRSLFLDALLLLIFGWTATFIWLHFPTAQPEASQPIWALLLLSTFPISLIAVAAQHAEWHHRSQLQGVD